MPEVLPAGRMVEVTMKIELPVAATREQIEEWVYAELGCLGGIGPDNPLFLSGPECVGDIWLTDTERRIRSERTEHGNGRATIRRWSEPDGRTT